MHADLPYIVICAGHTGVYLYYIVHTEGQSLPSEKKKIISISTHLIGAKGMQLPCNTLETGALTRESR